MRLTVSTKWTIDSILKALNADGCIYKRVDEGADMLACRLVGVAGHHYVYINLYSSKTQITYDLEDDRASGVDWDHAIERGKVSGIDELRRLCDAWLNGKDYIERVNRKVNCKSHSRHGKRKIRKGK